MKSLRELEDKFGFSEGKIKSMLYRIRQKLRKFLIKEDLI